MHVTNDFDLNKISKEHLSKVAGEIVKDPFNMSLKYGAYRLYVLNQGNKKTLNATLTDTFISTGFNLFEISTLLGLICAEISFLSNELYEVGEITHLIYCLYGEPQNVVASKMFFRENKKIEDYGEEDFRKL